MSVYPCIHRLFEDHAERTPDAVALVSAEGKCTYGELNARANRLGSQLVKIGVGPEVLVAISVERSPAMIVALLAILKAGGAYVPLDANYPADRLDFMLEDTAAPVLIARKSAPPVTSRNSRVVWIDEDGDESGGEITRGSVANSKLEVGPDNLAYVMYTSGSTGRPKGVMVEHHSVVRLVRETNYADLGASDVLLQLAPISFDASTFEIWGALLNGGTLAIMPPHPPSLDEIARAIQHFGVTTMWLTAGLFHVMVDQRLDGLKPLKQLLAGGDVLSPTHVRRFLDEIPGCRLINGYGPTEGTTFTCCHAMSSGDRVGNTVPIGRPVSNTQVYLLDSEFHPVPQGTAGELYAGGDGVARGYLNQAALTAENFIPDPFRADSCGMLYRTGDLARQMSDGAMEFLGRSDDQIKWNGFRIELGEIESVLGNCPGVRQTVVVARKDERSEERRLVAYVVPGPVQDSTSLRAHLEKRLPKYMIPSAFIALRALPLSPNGKVDKSALPWPDPGGREMKPAPMRGTLERRIAEVWRRVLSLGELGMDDNFFDLGGNSLQLIAVHAELNRELGIDLSITDLFQYTTVGALARHAGESGRRTPDFSAAQERAAKQREAAARHKRANVGVN